MCNQHHEKRPFQIVKTASITYRPLYNKALKAVFSVSICVNHNL
nr:MAG TPA: hypothetical protein [Caudoviricetes sp.]